MARYQKQRLQYPIGSVSHGTMREEDLIPSFVWELKQLANRGGVPRKQRTAHLKLVREIEKRIEEETEFADTDLGKEGMAEYDLESLFDALDAYAGPYFYFGAHPGDGSDYGFWLSEDWDEEFQSVEEWKTDCRLGLDRVGDLSNSPIKVNDLSEVPAKFRGEIAVVNDHGNVTLYVKTSRTLREIWGIV